MKYSIYHTILLTILFTVFSNCRSQELTFSKTDWEDPAIFQKGQNLAHAFHVPYDTKAEALSKSESSNLIPLNGLWDFKWLERPELVPEDFHKPKFNTKKWDKIKVPSNWQMEGYGHPKFRNIALSFESDPPYIPDYYNPTGCYKRKFNISSDWLKKDVMLRFEGIKSASYVWINGQKVGYNQGGFEPAEYEVSDFLKKGKNDISIEVIRFCDGSYLENQDMWRLSGIFRDVFLYALPKIHIDDFFHSSDFDENYENCELSVEVRISNSSKASVENIKLEVDVIDREQNSILQNKLLAEKLSIGSESSELVSLHALVKNPAKWSDEFPNLYTIIYVLKDLDGNTFEAFSKKIGFREVELKNNILLLNGRPLKLNGVNSHMHHPEFGQAVPLETLRKDLEIMKRNNINAVRTCHYPPSPEYLDLADELGIYIIDEVGDEAHGNIQLSYDSTYSEMYRDRSRKLVYRDRNHASVIIWSAGNESGSGFNIHEVIKTGKEIDPSRPAWMYGGNTFYIPFEDIVGPRYWTPYQLKNLAEGRILEEDDLRPSFMDEYLAATGNGLGGLDEYWDLIRKYPRLIGGAIWDWISPGITTPLWLVPDNSPNKIDGAIMGRPEFVPGHQGRALKFSGHDDWIEFYRDSALDICGNELSISFWVNPSPIPQPNTFLAKGSHSYGIRMQVPDSIEFYIQTNNLNTIYQTPYYRTSTKRIAVSSALPADWYGNWHHLAGIYDGDFLRLFIDKTEVAKTAFKGAIADSPFPLCIGRDAEKHDQGEFSGRLSSMIIDDIQIFNSAMSIDELYNGADPENSVLSLDFEKDTKNGSFYAVGLGGRTYGIVWPDRSIQPELHQIKKSGQAIKIEDYDQKNGKFRVVNQYAFKNLNEYDIFWEVLRRGESIETGLSSLDLPAGDTGILKIPFSKIKTSGEIILTISFKLKETNHWANKGYEVAWEQFILQESLQEFIYPEKGKLSISESNDQITISGDNFEYSLSKTNGEFLKMVFEDKNLIDAGPKFSIWRAPLANDIDPWGAFTYSDENTTEGLGRSIDNTLRTLGLKDLAAEISEVDIREDDQQLTLKYHKYYNSSNMRGAFESVEKYIFYPNGSIDLVFSITPHSRMPDMLPRMGWQVEIPKIFRNIEWYGRGPFETYPDRKTGAKAGIYKSDVDREYVPYIIPQDYGNHTDSRWLKIQDSEGRGIKISSDNTFNFSYHKFTTDNLSRAMYTYQLHEAPQNILSIDFEVSGVGGTAIRQLENYRVKAEEGVYRLRLEPF